MATFSLLSNFSNYIRNPVKILVTMPKFGKVFFWQQSEQARIRMEYAIRIRCLLAVSVLRRSTQRNQPDRLIC